VARQVLDALPSVLKPPRQAPESVAALRDGDGRPLDRIP
jgi:hypothetical protein